MITLRWSVRRRLALGLLALVVPVSAAAVQLSTAQAASAASAIGGSITRAEVVARGKSWVDQGVDYSTSSYHSDTGNTSTYRQDCSGFVSMAWHLNTSLTTSGFDTWSGKTNLGSLTDALPGDALLKMSGTAHIALFVSWADGAHTQANLYSEPSPGGQAHAYTQSVSSLASDGYRAIRYNKVVDHWPSDLAWVQGNTMYTFAGSDFATIGAVSGLPAPQWFGVGDYDHDGHDDVFYYYSSSQSLIWLKWMGTYWASMGNLRSGIGTPNWAAVGDFDGDGYRDDIAWMQGDTIFTFSGSGMGTIASVSGIGTPTWAGVMDYNKDGKDDLLWFYGSNGTLHTGLSNGNSFYTWTQRRGPGIGTPTWAGVGDFDGNGYRDEIAWMQGGTIYTFKGDAFGTTASVSGIGTPVWGGVGDYTADGKDDLIFFDGSNIATGQSNGNSFYTWVNRRGPGVGTPTWAGVGAIR